MGLLKYLIYFSILSMPAGMILRLQLSNGVAINYIDLVTLVTSLLGVFYLFRKKDLNFSYKKEVLVFLIICIISLLFNYHNFGLNKTLLSSLYLLRLVSYFLIFVLVSKQSNKTKPKILNLVLFSGLVFSVLGFIQLIFYPYLRNIAYLGWDVHLDRLVSSFLDPNFAGVFFGINSILIFNLIWQKYQSGKSIDLLKIVLLTISIISLVLTYSRGAILAFIVALIFNLIFLNGKKLLVPIILIIILVLGFLIVSKRSEGTNIMRVTSTLARAEVYKEGFIIFKNHPILGVGFNSYRFAAEKYHFPRDYKYPYPDHGFSGNDNSFLFILDTTGILGFGAFIYFINKLLTTVWKDNKNLYSRSLFFSLVLVFISSFFVNALFFPVILFYIFLLMGLRESK